MAGQPVEIEDKAKVLVDSIFDAELPIGWHIQKSQSGSFKYVNLHNVVRNEHPCLNFAISYFKREVEMQGKENLKIDSAKVKKLTKFAECFEFEPEINLEKLKKRAESLYKDKLHESKTDHNLALA